jgi:uncharacterized protein with HEPN domain
MITKDYGDYLQDILDAINEIKLFVQGMNFQEFLEDKKTINAVIWLNHWLKKF